MLEFCQSDTDLLELDPFASIHHINDVIRRCHEDEALGGSSGSPVHEAIEDTIFHSAPEVSIFGRIILFPSHRTICQCHLQTWTSAFPQAGRKR